MRTTRKTAQALHRTVWCERECACSSRWASLTVVKEVWHSSCTMQTELRCCRQVQRFWFEVGAVDAFSLGLDHDHIRLQVEVSTDEIEESMYRVKGTILLHAAGFIFERLGEAKDRIRVNAAPGGVK